MTREDIYDHLAQVYLGKRKEVDEKKKRQFNAWLLINVIITVIIFGSAFYGLTAFLTQRSASFKSNIIYSLHNGMARVEYNFNNPFPPTKTFTLSLPEMDAEKYTKLQFAVRGKEEDSPGIIKIVFRNKKNETSSYYIHGVDTNWQEYSIPFESFKQITDWSNIEDISFVLESWNVNRKRGTLLIDNICFAGIH